MSLMYYGYPSFLNSYAPYPAFNRCAQDFDMDTLRRIDIEVGRAQAALQRVPVIHRQVFKVPSPPPRVRTVVRRLKTPTPDTIERTYVSKQPQEYVNLIIEKPKTPVVIRNQQVVENTGLPVVNHKVVQVLPRSYGTKSSILNRF